MQGSVNIQSPIDWASPLNRGLLRWWCCLPNQLGTPWRELTRRSHMTITGALGIGRRGRIGGYGSYIFDGINDYGQTAAINLSSISTLTVSFWLFWNAFATDDDMALETSATSNSNAGAFQIDPNMGGTSDVLIAINTNGAQFSGVQFARTGVTAAAWQHWTVCMDRNAGAQQVTAVYINGRSQSLSNTFTNTTATGGFGNYAWNFMSRNGASLFGAGRLDDIRIYNRVLSAGEVRALLAASKRGYPNELRWSRGAEFGGYIDEASPEDPYIPYSVPYHRRSFKAMAPIKNAGHAMGTLSSAVPLTTIPGNALRARVVGVSGSATVYFREDEGTPSATNGTPIGAGGYADIVGRNNLEGFRAIEASPSGTLWVEYFDSVE